ncbi:hypothetical protein PRSY57_0009500, partial [Plasmodium reichenowi]
KKHTQKHTHKEKKNYTNNIYDIINKDNFDENKNIFEFLNPIFNYDNVQNFINHYIHIIKNYNDTYLKHYIYHYYLFNYDFTFQNVYNFSNIEHIHYIKNDANPPPCSNNNNNNNNIKYNNNIHLLYTSIINTYVNFCACPTKLNQYNSSNNNRISQYKFLYDNYCMYNNQNYV